MAIRSPEAIDAWAALEKAAAAMAAANNDFVYIGVSVSVLVRVARHGNSAIATKRTRSFPSPPCDGFGFNIGLF